MLKHQLTPFKEMTPVPPPRAVTEDHAKATGQTVDEVVSQIAQAMKVVTYKNNYYTVLKRTTVETGIGPMFHLSITRNDGKAESNWDDFQQIKNMLCGPEFEAVEIYPKETRRFDFGNTFHLWVLMTEGHIFPFGLKKT